MGVFTLLRNGVFTLLRNGVLSFTGIITKRFSLQKSHQILSEMIKEMSVEQYHYIHQRMLKST